MQPCNRLVVGQAFPPALRCGARTPACRVDTHVDTFCTVKIRPIYEAGNVTIHQIIHSISKRRDRMERVTCDTRPSCGAGGSACRIFRPRRSRRVP